MRQKYQSILFLDIETVPSPQNFSDLGARGQEVFEDRFKRLLLAKSETHTGTKLEALSELYQENAALYAEFNRIVSIGMGYFGFINKDLPHADLISPENFEFRVKVVVHKDEKVVLEEFCKAIRTDNFTRLCGHNIMDFDGPMSCRRMTVNSIPIPGLLDPTGKKTWEVPWLDTLKHWAFNEWGHKISLDRLCYALGIPSPKADISGADVKDYFYGLPQGEEDLPFDKFDKESERFAVIAKYQAGDIVALANAFLRLNGEGLIPEHKIKYV